MNNTLVAMQRLAMMGDWLRLRSFDDQAMNSEIQLFEKDWKQYNPRKKINRYGLSITSLNGGLDGCPDLDSVYEYNRENSTNYDNQSFKQTTAVFDKSETLRKTLNPFLPWLGRCHFLRLDSGGFFPEHYDIDKTNYEFDEIRLIGFVKNTSPKNFKFCYEDRILQDYNDGDLFYFNANKRHSVFSMKDDVILLVVTLKFDESLFEVLINNYSCK